MYTQQLAHAGMLSRYFVHNTQLYATARWFTSSSITQAIDQPSKDTKTEIPKSDGVLGSRMHRVSEFDKKVLVWVKRYPNIAAVPKDVTVECLLAARSKARIKCCNYMIVATIFGCIGAVILGKRQAERGETLTKMREDMFQDSLTNEKKG